MAFGANMLALFNPYKEDEKKKQKAQPKASTIVFDDSGNIFSPDKSKAYSEGQKIGMDAAGIAAKATAQNKKLEDVAKKIETSKGNVFVDKQTKQLVGTQQAQEKYVEDILPQKTEKFLTNNNAAFSNAIDMVNQHYDALKTEGFAPEDIEAARQAEIDDINGLQQEFYAKADTNRSAILANANIDTASRNKALAKMDIAKGQGDIIDQINAIPGVSGGIQRLAQADRSITAGVPQGIAEILKLPKAIRSITGNNPLLQALPLVNQRDAEGFALWAKPLDQIVNQVKGTEQYKTGEKEFPIVTQLGQVAGETLPLIAAEAVTGGLAPGFESIAMRQLAKTGLNRGAQRSLARAGSVAAESGVEELLQSPGRQFTETGKVDIGRLAQDVGTAVGMGGFAGYGLNKAAEAIGPAGKRLANMQANAAQRKAAKEIVEKAEPEAAMIPPAKANEPELPQDEIIRQNTYKESAQRITEINRANKNLNKQIKEVSEAGDYQRAAQLKRQKQVLSAEKKQVQSTIKELEARAPELDINKSKPMPSEQPDIPVSSQSVPEQVETLKQPEPIQKGGQATDNSKYKSTADEVERILGENQLNSSLKQQKLQEPNQIKQQDFGPQDSLKGIEAEGSLKKSQANQPNQTALETLQNPELNQKPLKQEPQQKPLDTQLNNTNLADDIPAPGIDKIKKTIPKDADFDEKMANAFLKADPRSYALGRPPEIKSWKEFQELKRNPKNFKSLKEQAKEIGVKISDDTQAKVDELTNVKVQIKDRELTEEVLKARIVKQMEKEGLKELKLKDGSTIKLTGFKQTRLNAIGEQQIAAYIEDQFKKGRLKQITSNDAFNVQPAREAKNLAGRYGITDLNQLGDEFIKYKTQRQALEAAETSLKRDVDLQLKGFPDEGLRQVFRSSNGDAVLWKSKGAQKIDTAPIKLDLDAKRQALKDAGFGESKDVTQLRTKIDKNIQSRMVKEAIETGEIKSKRVASAILEKEKTEIANAYSFDPQLIGTVTSILTDSPDLLVGAISARGGFSRLLPKLADIEITPRGGIKLKGQANSNTIALQQVGEVLDLAVASSTNIETKLLRSNSKAVKQFLEDYEFLRGREAHAQDVMKHKFSKDEFLAVQKAFKEYGSLNQIQKALEKGDVIEGLENPDMQRIVQALINTRTKRTTLIKDALKNPTINSADKQNLELFLRMEEGVNRGTMSEVIRKAGSLAMAKALYNRISSIPAILTDPILKGALSGASPQQIIAGMKDVFKHRKTALFNAYQAGKAGTYLDDAKGLGAVVDKINSFGFTTELANDMIMFQQARKFNDEWFKETGQKIDIVKDFDPLSEAGQEFSMKWNKVSNELLGVGVGELEKFALQKDQGVKSFIALMSEPLRYSNLVVRNFENIYKAALTKDSKKLMSAAMPLLSFTAYGTLIGGDKFLEGTPVLGHIYNFIKNKVDPEDRDNFERTLDTYTLAGVLKLNLGDKIQSIPTKRRNGENILQALSEGITEGEFAKSFTGESIVSLKKKLEKGLNMLAEDNPEGWLEIAKSLPYTSGPAGFFESVLRKTGILDSNKTVWLKEDGQLKDVQKPSEWIDILGESQSAKDLKKAAELRTEAKKEGVENLKVSKMGKKYIYEGDGNRFEKFINVLSKDEYNPYQSRSRDEVQQFMLEKIYKKQMDNEEKKGKFAAKNSVAFVKTLSKNELQNRLASAKGAQREALISNIKQARKESPRSRKYNNLSYDLRSQTVGV